MAYIKTEEVAQIRKELKEAFPQLKFGVRKHHHSSVDVTIKAGTVDFSDILDDNGYSQVNQYWLTEDRVGKHVKLFEKIIDIIKTAPAKVPGGRAWFDDSDSMTDYFHTAFYFSINVGAWNKPYVCSKAAKKASKKVVKASKNSRAFNGWTPQVIDGSVGSITLPTKSTISDASGINETSEQVARMTAKEQDKFVEDIVSRYPNLADTLMTKLGYGLLEHEGE